MQAFANMAGIFASALPVGDVPPPPLFDVLSSVLRVMEFDVRGGASTLVNDLQFFIDEVNTDAGFENFANILDLETEMSEDEIADVRDSTCAL